MLVSTELRPGVGSVYPDTLLGDSALIGLGELPHRSGCCKCGLASPQTSVLQALQIAEAARELRVAYRPRPHWEQGR